MDSAESKISDAIAHYVRTELALAFAEHDAGSHPDSDQKDDINWKIARRDLAEAEMKQAISDAMK